ncbi:MAG: nitrous oxide-stimulated promoter family protein [Candidatus Kapabacteria bacterium]|nr:nitrous oxide-stimulated promoter family protein [Candidatus Kapabacteria bacterium]
MIKFLDFYRKSRIGRERKTILKMIDLYCRINHNTKNNLCKSCSELAEYANNRLEKCPFGQEKPTCINCTVHCYRKSERERIREIMRFSGPRMIKYHPYLALMHIVDNKLG